MPASLRHLASAKEASKSVDSVLALWPADGLYYTVTIVECGNDEQDRRCRVVFEDGHTCWMSAQNLHCQILMDHLADENIVCCVCDKGHSIEPNPIIICDECQQGYHLACHNPPVLPESGINLGNDETEWTCATCVYIIKQFQKSRQQAKRHRRVTVSSTTTPRKPITKKTHSRSVRKSVPVADVTTPPKSDPSPDTTVELENFQETKPIFKAEPIQSEQPTEPTSDLTVALIPPQTIQSKPSSHGNAGRIEKMGPLVIAAAKLLAEDATCVGTKEFLGLVAEEQTAIVNCDVTTEKKGSRKMARSLVKKVPKKSEIKPAAVAS